jgi:site-specific recombinase XerD
MKDQLIQGFTVYLREHARTERTVSAYVCDVTRYLDWCAREYGQPFNLAMFNRSDLVDYQVYSRKHSGYKAATWNRAIASLQVFANWLLETQQMDYSPVEALHRAESQKLAPKSLPKFEYKRFRLAVCEALRVAVTPAARWMAIRNAAIITLLADAGLREGEIVHLRPQDLHLGERKGRVSIQDGKGHKDRTVPLDYDSVLTLKAWLEVRGQGFDTAKSAPTQPTAPELFHGKRGDALQERGIQKLVNILAADAHIGHVTPHQLRHTAAYRLIKAGANLNEVAEILGHSRIEVTRRYTLPHYEDLEALVEAM